MRTGRSPARFLPELLVLAGLFLFTNAKHADIGILVPLRWLDMDQIQPWAIQWAASATMAVHHINHRVTTLVPEADELLPPNFTLTFDIQDSLTQPSTAVRHAVSWNEAKVSAIIGSYRSAVCGPLALAASIEDTPVIAWAASASFLDDRATYPTLSRTVTSDRVLAEHMIWGIAGLGWTRIATISVDDAWGRSFAHDLTDAAFAAGLDLNQQFTFELGDASAMEAAVRRVADSDARVVLCLIYDSDVVAVAAAAEKMGLLKSGFAWILGTDPDVESLAQQSVDPESARRQLAGWLTVWSDAVAPERTARFRETLRREPLEHLNHSILQGALDLESLETVDQYGGLMYDAVWTAAIALGRVGVGEDGGVDKRELLGAIRGVEFEGATGAVGFDAGTGERDARAQGLILRNLRGGGGGGGLEKVVTWRWERGADGVPRVEAENVTAPVWPGGEEGWKLPTPATACPPGLVFSSASFRCEACPRGRVAEGGACVKVHGSIGVTLPLRSGGAAPGAPLSPFLLRIAASAALAVRHVNQRVAAVVGAAAEGLPADFRLVWDLRDSEREVQVAVDHVLAWSEQRRHAVIGAGQSGVTGPLALAASLAGAMPVIGFASTASELGDRGTYPTLSRTSFSDAALAESTVRAIRAMNWTRLAILHVNNAWGRAFVGDAAGAASSLGVEVASAASFATRDAGEIERAVARTAGSGARVILCLADASDVGAIAETADDARFGLLEGGFVWVVPNDFSPEEVIDDSADPARRERQLTGWLLAAFDSELGGRRGALQRALEEEPLEHLDQAVFEGALTREVIRGAPCSEFCGLMYDAVWTAAIALGRVGVGEDGGVDKRELLGAIRGVEFEGATGAVGFDAGTGERDARAQGLILRNLRGRGAGGGLEKVVTWRWDREGGMQRVSAVPPVWPGGEEGWEVRVEPECGGNEVFNQGSLACEACPAGTTKVERGCERYDARLGLLIPLRWLSEEAGIDAAAARYAAAAAMAVIHINARDAAVVPRARELLPPGFRLVLEIQDSQARPSVGVQHVVRWHDEGFHAVIGTWRSAVTAPIALAASIFNMPIVAWASSAASLGDVDAYPTLGRTVVSDAVLARYLARFMRSLRWSRVAILYVNDAWGRGFAQDASERASEVGIVVLRSASFELQNAADIRGAVAQIAASRARIVLCLAFEVDLPAIADAADALGLFGAGYAWLLGYDPDFNALVAQSEDPARRQRQFEGWLTASIDPSFGRLGRFNSVLDSAPREQLPVPGLRNLSSLSASCDQYCGLIYDAVWTAALGMSKMELAEDGSTDSDALLAAIRAVAFEGATGQVAFDAATGERDIAGSPLPLLVKNLQVPSNGSGLLANELVWLWHEEEGRRADGAGELERVGGEAPMWPGAQRGWGPPHDGFSCQEGWVFEATALECQPCPPGTQMALNRTVCEACPRGSAAGRSGSVRCSECQVGYAHAEGMTACLPCPDNTLRPAHSPGVSALECECQVGYYRQLGPGSPCAPCMTGASCPGGEAAPFPVEGFWADSNCSAFGRGGEKACEHWELFMECNPPESCLGGPRFECGTGRVGRLCFETEAGYSNVAMLFWWPCGAYGGLVTGGAILGVLGVWFAINAVAANQFDALNIALLFIQVTALISSYGLKWHPRLHWLNVIMAVTNFDVDLVSAACLVPWTPVSSFYLQLLLPFVFGLAYMVSFVVTTGWRRCRTAGSGSVRRDSEWKHGMHKTLKYFVSFVYINYTTLSLKSFQALSCTVFPDGELYLVHAPSVKCWTGSHWIMAGLAAFCIVCILLGLPLLTWGVLRHHIRNGTLHDPETEFRWGFCHSPYKASSKYWELVVTMRRFSIALIAVIVEEPMLQAGATLVVLVALLTAHIYVKPFLSKKVDVLDFVAICASMLYTLAGMFFYPSTTKRAQGHLCTYHASNEFCAKDVAVKDAVSVICIATIGLTVLMAVVFTLRSVREKRASTRASSAIRKMQGLRRTESQSRLEQSVNRVGLDEIFDGRQLLAWARSLDKQGSSHFVACPVSYQEVEEEILQIGVDLTHAAKHPTAAIMRHLCEIDGFLDFLVSSDGAGALGLSTFIRELAAFLDAATAKGLKARVHSMIQFQHRPILAYWLAHAPATRRHAFDQLVDAIRHANGIHKRNTLMGWTGIPSMPGSPWSSSGRLSSGGGRRGIRSLRLLRDNSTRGSERTLGVSSSGEEDGKDARASVVFGPPETPRAPSTPSSAPLLPPEASSGRSTDLGGGASAWESAVGAGVGGPGAPSLPPTQGEEGACEEGTAAADPRSRQRGRPRSDEHPGGGARLSPCLELTAV